MHVNVYASLCVCIWRGMYACGLCVCIWSGVHTYGVVCVHMECCVHMGVVCVHTYGVVCMHMDCVCA